MKRQLRKIFYTATHMQFFLLLLEISSF